MMLMPEGWHELVTDRAGTGTRYQFRLPNGLWVPDPASRFQPEDVHGASEVIDPRAYAWRDQGWAGRRWEEAVIYELHIGAFTPEGTFLAAIRKLDYLVDLGVTAIEIMPVGDFPGRRNWGYDGVLLYSPDSTYGRPEELKALIDAAHERELMIFLDVVYNHFGPDGNYLASYAPCFFTERHKTPWGAAINYDGQKKAAVREFMIENALYWIEEYCFDGLRLDAVHAIIDDSPTHILTELAERVRTRVTERQVHLILENDENEARRLVRDANGAPRYYTAQWNDDVHHALHAAATAEDSGYYVEYLGDTQKLARALAEGFAFQGEVMAYRGRKRGEPSAELPPSAFIAFIQNHDQIGNRAFGERIRAIASEESVRAIAAVYLLAPQVPMLFMGEEWGSTQPFSFFCDFKDDLAKAVRKGRREEFKKFPEFHEEESRNQIPDPSDENTFFSAKLRWNDLDSAEGAGWRDWYSRMLAVRRERIIPLLANIPGHAGRYHILGEGAVVVRWKLNEQGELALAANLSDKTLAGFPGCSGNVIWQEGPAAEGDSFAAWSVRWSLEPIRLEENPRAG
jgi:malto-oligosyltrehalose trehalohydrolase